MTGAEPSRRRSITTLVVGSFGSQAATLLAIPILSRLYGPTPFGYLAIFVAFSTVIAVLVTLRYELAIVLPRDLDSAASLFLLLLKLQLMFGVGGTLVAAVGSISFGRETEWATLIVALPLGVISLSIFSTQTYFLSRQGLFHAIAVSRFIQGTSIAALQIINGLLFGGQPLALVLGLVLGQVVGSLACHLLFARRALSSANVSLDRAIHLIRDHWRMPAFNAPHALLDAARTGGISLILAATSVQIAGQYSLVLRVLQAPVALLAGAVSQVYFPHLAALDRKELAPAVRGSIVRCLILGAPLFGIVFVAAPSAAPLALGPGWEQTGVLAQALVPWIYVNFATSPVSTLFVVLNRQALGLGVNIVQLSLPLSLLWFLRADPVTAVWAMSVSQAGVLGALLILMMRVAGSESRRYRQLEGRD